MRDELLRILARQLKQIIDARWWANYIMMHSEGEIEFTILYGISGVYIVNGEMKKHGFAGLLRGVCMAITRPGYWGGNT